MEKKEQINKSKIETITMKECSTISAEAVEEAKRAKAIATKNTNLSMPSEGERER